MLSSLQQVSKWGQVVMYCSFVTYCYCGEADFDKWWFDLLLCGSECSLF